MTTLNNVLQMPLNMPEQESQTEFLKPAMTKPTDEHHGISPETEAWLERVVTVYNRMDKDEEYRKEVARKSW